MRKKRVQNEVVETNLPKKEENVLKITKRQRKTQIDKNVDEDDKLVALESTEEEVPKKMTKISKKKDLDENNENADLEKEIESNGTVETKNDDKKTKVKDNKKKTNKESTKKDSKDVQQLEENPISNEQDSIEKQTVTTLTKKVSKRSLRLENKNKLENSEQSKVNTVIEPKEVTTEKVRKNSKKEKDEKIILEDSNLDTDKVVETKEIVKPKEKLTKKKSKTNIILEEPVEESKPLESEKSPKKKAEKPKKGKPEPAEEAESTETVIKQTKGKKGNQKKKEVEEPKETELVVEKSLEEPLEEVEEKKSLKKTKSSSQLPKNKKVKKSEEPEEPEVKSPEKKSKVEMGKKKKSNLKELKIISWNVNGVRACIKNNLMEFINKEDPDIFCLQEVKCNPENMPDELKELSNYHCYWFVPSEKNGYSGVAVFSKIEPIKITNGFNDEEHDKEGRIITCEFDTFYLINVYATNASLKLVNLDKKRDWNEKFKDYLNKLDKKKPLIACGDFNCAHKEIDLKNPKTNKKTAGFTPEEREDFGDLLDSGFIDSFRFLYPDKIDAYTFWSTRQNSRQKNVGWRLDYFLLSDSLKENLVDNIINDETLGSDHCPITLLIKMDV